MTLDISADLNARIEETETNATVSSSVGITANIENVVSITGELNIDDVTIEADLGEGGAVSYDTYTGEYEVTSFLPENLITSSVILPTRSKLMTNNVTVYSLPVSEEYNAQGGVTMTIGG